MKKIFLAIILITLVAIGGFTISGMQGSKTYTLDFNQEEILKNNAYYVPMLETLLTYSEDGTSYLLYDYDATNEDGSTGAYIPYADYLEKFLEYDDEALAYYKDMDGEKMYINEISPVGYQNDEALGVEVYYDPVLSTYYYVDDESNIFMKDNDTGEYLIYEDYMIAKGYTYDAVEDAYYIHNDEYDKDIYYNVYYGMSYFYNDNGDMYYYEKAIDFGFTLEESNTGLPAVYDKSGDLYAYDTTLGTCTIVEDGTGSSLADNKWLFLALGLALGGSLVAFFNSSKEMKEIENRYVNSINESADDFSDKVKDTVETTKEEAKDVFDDVKENLEETKENLKGKIDNIVEKDQGNPVETAEDLEDVVEKVEDKEV